MSLSSLRLASTHLSLTDFADILTKLGPEHGGREASGGRPAGQASTCRRGLRNQLAARALLAFAECIADAAVGGGRLAVDAVGVDTEQHLRAVSGTAGGVGGGHAGRRNRDNAARLRS
jgi:hypothetical protein